MGRERRSGSNDDPRVKGGLSGGDDRTAGEGTRLSKTVEALSPRVFRAFVTHLVGLRSLSAVETNGVAPFI